MRISWSPAREWKGGQSIQVLPRCGKGSLVNSCPECKSAICYEEQKYCMSCGAPLQKDPGHGNHPDHGAHRMKGPVKSSRSAFAQSSARYGRPCAGVY